MNRTILNESGAGGIGHVVVKGFRLDSLVALDGSLAEIIEADANHKVLGHFDACTHLISEAEGIVILLGGGHL